ncbi:MAG TPA: dihydrofolate reductase family protein [Gaiellaceae bacterium]
MTAALRSLLRLRPLEVLVDATGPPTFELPDGLADVYGGSLGFTQPRLYANLVASVDGVTAIPGRPQSSHLIAAGSEHDRFVIGLLRASADAVLIGAGTLRDSPRTRWTPEHAYPAAADLYAELRRRRGRPPQPTLAVLTGSGRIDPRHPGLSERTLVLTSEQGAAELGRSLPRTAAIVPLGSRPPLAPHVAVEALRAGGHELILCEGGPSLLGGFVRAGLVDELFLTLSPALGGRPAAEPRLSLLEEADIPELLVLRLLSLRRAGSHLFLRYLLPTAAGSRVDGAPRRPGGEAG